MCPYGESLRLERELALLAGLLFKVCFQEQIDSLGLLLVHSSLCDQLRYCLREEMLWRRERPDGFPLQSAFAVDQAGSSSSSGF
jgi:hypothetical protein